MARSKKRMFNHGLRLEKLIPIGFKFRFTPLNRLYLVLTMVRRKEIVLTSHFSTNVWPFVYLYQTIVYINGTYEFSSNCSCTLITVPTVFSH